MRLYLILVAVAAILSSPAYGADYPIHRRQVARPYTPLARCDTGHFSYRRYLPVLATSYWIRPVFVPDLPPCPEYRYGYR